MRNCVASYAPRIQQQQVSIFHAAPNDGGDDADSALGVTVEVNRASRSVVQVKGFANRAARPAELAALARWTKQVGLRLTSDTWADDRVGAGEARRRHRRARLDCDPR